MGHSHSPSATVVGCLAAWYLTSIGYAQTRDLRPVARIDIASPSPYPAGAAGGSVVWTSGPIQADGRDLSLHISMLDLGTHDRLEVLDATGRLVSTLTESHRGARWLAGLGDPPVTVQLVADEVDEGRGVHLDMLSYRSEGKGTPTGEDVLGAPEVPDGLFDIRCYENATVPAQPCEVSIPPNPYESGRAVARLVLLAQDLGSDAITEFHCTGFHYSSDNPSDADFLLTAGHCLTDFVVGGGGGAPVYRVVQVDAEFFREYRLTEFKDGSDYPVGMCRCGDGTGDPGPATRCDTGVPCDTPASSETGLCPNEPVVTIAGLDWTVDPLCKHDWGVVWLDTDLIQEDIPALELSNQFDSDFFAFMPQHPDGRCKEVAFGIVGGIVPAQPWLFEHDLDTQGGSSGAPVIGQFTDEVLGVHTGRLTDDSGGATRIETILASLDDVENNVLNDADDSVEWVGEALDHPDDPGFQPRYAYEVHASPHIGDGKIYAFHVGTQDSKLDNHRPITTPPGWKVVISVSTPSHLQSTALAATPFGDEIEPPVPLERDAALKFWVSWYADGAPGVDHFVFSHSHPGKPYDAEWVTTCDDDDIVWNLNAEQITSGIRDSAEWFSGGVGKGDSLVYGPKCAAESANGNDPCACPAVSGSAPDPLPLSDSFNGPCLDWEKQLNGQAQSAMTHFSLGRYHIVEIEPVANPTAAPRLRLFRSFEVADRCYVETLVHWDMQSEAQQQRTALHLRGKDGQDLVQVMITDLSSASGPHPRFSLAGGIEVDGDKLPRSGSALLRLDVRRVSETTWEYTGRVFHDGQVVLYAHDTTDRAADIVEHLVLRSDDPTIASGTTALDEFSMGVTCLGDITGDAIVNSSDLLSLLDAWGACSSCLQDLTGDDVVDVFDLFVLLKEWGLCH